jgi:hypothetical protein
MNVSAFQWAVDGNHSFPSTPPRPHRLTDCWCQPFDYEGVIVHNSMDQREIDSFPVSPPAPWSDSYFDPRSSSLYLLTVSVR